MGRPQLAAAGIVKWWDVLASKLRDGVVVGGRRYWMGGHDMDVTYALNAESRITRCQTKDILSG